MSATLADRVLMEISKSKQAMRSDFVDIDNVEAYYLDLDLKDAVVELDRAL